MNGDGAKRNIKIVCRGLVTWTGDEAEMRIIMKCNFRVFGNKSNVVLNYKHSLKSCHFFLFPNQTIWRNRKNINGQCPYVMMVTCCIYKNQ